MFYKTPARFSFWSLMLSHKRGVWALGSGVFLCILIELCMNQNCPNSFKYFHGSKDWFFFICRGLLKIKPCCWRWRQLWEEVAQSIPALSTRTGSFPRHGSTVTGKNLLRFPNHCPQRKAVIYVSLHSFDNDWFVFSPPFSHSWMKDGWMMTETIFWMTCTWTC